MPTTTHVLTAFRNELEGAGLIRRPGDAGELPPMFVEPITGPPAPGEREGTEAGDELVVTLRLSSELPARAGEAFVRGMVFDVVYRSTGTAGLKQGRDLDAAIRARLIQTAGYGTGVMLDEGGTHPTFVHELLLFAGVGPIAVDGDVRTELAKYGLEVLA